MVAKKKWIICFQNANPSGLGEPIFKFYGNNRFHMNRYSDEVETFTETEAKNHAESMSVLIQDAEIGEFFAVEQ